MKTVAVIGADSFLGQHLIDLLSTEEEIQIRALVYTSAQKYRFDPNKVITIKGDLLKPETLTDFLVSGCSVVNLAYLWQQTKEKNLLALSNLAKLCRKAKVKRFLHCSTAVVAGRTMEKVISERTICQPINEYEINKLAMEKFVLDQLGNDCQTVILRPTAVFGPGGKNLLRLADDLTKGKRWLNYLKSSLFGKRRMNLVCIDNVIAAIKFLLDTDKKISREVFIISDDEVLMNNYRNLEQYLMNKYSIRDYALPPVALLSLLLPFFLRLAKISNLNPNATYACQKIKDLGFVKPAIFEQGLDKFITWYKRQ